MRVMRRVIVGTCLGLAVTPRPSHAQQDQIPKELALALIPFGASEGGEIIVGKLPPDLAASITLPAGGRVLGSFVSLGYGQAVLALPLNADSARAFVRGQLIEHGWKATAPMNARVGGLQYGQRGSVPTIFCKTGTPGSVNLSSQFYGRETLVRLTRNSDMSACDGNGGFAATAVGVTTVGIAAREASFPLSTLPPLWSPGDPISSMRACRPQSSTVGVPYQSQEQWLRTELSAQAILDYYGRQLDSAGWKPAATDEHVARTWTSASTSGDSAQDVTLTVTRMKMAGCYEIDLKASARGAKR